MKKHKPELSPEEFDQIDRYVSDDMPEQEAVDFRREMEANPSLREEVAIQQKLMAAIELDSFFKSKEIQQGRSRSIPLWKYGIAASLALIAVVLVWLSLGRGIGEEEDLFSAYYYPDPGLPVPMSSTDSYEFDDGMVSYKEEAYAEAEAVWTELRRLGDTDTLVFYVAMAKLNQGQAAESSVLLDQIRLQPESEFYEKALWYSALIQLKEGKLEEAKATLLEMRGDDPRTQELLDRLR